MANDITWTMSSIYLVGSLLALNGSLAQQLINTRGARSLGLQLYAFRPSG
jgi:hypothetical protein